MFWLWPEELVAISWCFFRSKTVTRDVLGDHAREQKVQKIIRAAGFGAATAHFKSAEWVPPNNCACAGAIDVEVTRFDLRFGAFDVRRAAREKPGRQRIIGAVCHSDRFFEVAHFYHAHYWPEDFLARDAHPWFDVHENCRWNEITFGRHIFSLIRQRGLRLPDLDVI